jgi:hypothetical protein
MKAQHIVGLLALSISGAIVASGQVVPRAAALLTIVECEGKTCTPGNPGSVTWTFTDIHRTGLWTPGNQQVSIVHLDHDSIAVHRLDVNGPSKGITATYLGKIVGNRIVGSVVYYPAEPKLHPDTDAWSGTIQGAGLAQASVPNKSSAAGAPSRIVVCEGDQCTADSKYPQIWTLDVVRGTGMLQERSQPPTPDRTIRIEHFDGIFLTVHRVDVSGPSEGMTALYMGLVRDRQIDGTVVYYSKGRLAAATTKLWKGTIEDPRVMMPEAFSSDRPAASMPEHLVACADGNCNVFWTFNGSKGKVFLQQETAPRGDLAVESFTPDEIAIRFTNPAIANVSALFKGKFQSNQIQGYAITKKDGVFTRNPWFAVAPATSCTRTDGLIPSAQEALEIGRNAIGFHLMSKALECFLIAAKDGTTAGQDSTAYLYLKGFAPQIAQDYNKAFYWINKSASQGDYLGELMLSTMYLEGHGVPVNKEKADYWTAQARTTAEGRFEAQKQARVENQSSNQGLQNQVTGAIAAGILGAILGGDEPEGGERYQNCMMSAKSSADRTTCQYLRTK